MFDDGWWLDPPCWMGKPIMFDDDDDDDDDNYIDIYIDTDTAWYCMVLHGTILLFCFKSDVDAGMRLCVPVFLGIPRAAPGVPEQVPCATSCWLPGHWGPPAARRTAKRAPGVLPTWKAGRTRCCPIFCWTNLPTKTLMLPIFTNSGCCQCWPM